MKPKEIGIVGLGKMGSGVAALALEKGYKVVGSTKGDYPEELNSLGMIAVDELGALTEALSAPRILLLSLPAGKTIDLVADQLADLLEPGDIILDSGNSYWGDSQQRHHKYAQNGIHFLDLGTSGGLEGARLAPCFMICGPKDAVRTVEQFLLDLATTGGYVHAGGPGAGHYVKLVRIRHATGHWRGHGIAQSPSRGDEYPGHPGMLAPRLRYPLMANRPDGPSLQGRSRFHKA